MDIPFEDADYAERFQRSYRYGVLNRKTRPDCLISLPSFAGGAIFPPRPKKPIDFGLGNSFFFKVSATLWTWDQRKSKAYLNHLAVNRRVAASTQPQVLNALVFLYADDLGRPLGRLESLKRVQYRKRIPTVLTIEEAKRTLAQMTGTTRLMAELIYGAVLRVHECTTLRVKDIDLSAKVLSIRNSKGSKDRTTLLPEQLIQPLQAHLIRVASLHRDDLARGAGIVPLPDALDRKYSSAARSFAVLA